MKRLVTILTLVVLSLTCLGGNLSSRTVRIPTDTGRMKVKVLRPKQTDVPVPGILWIHGGRIHGRRNLYAGDDLREDACREIRRRPGLPRLPAGLAGSLPSGLGGLLCGA